MPVTPVGARPCGALHAAVPADARYGGRVTAEAWQELATRGISGTRSTERRLLGDGERTWEEFLDRIDRIDRMPVRAA
ncbi:hypothetical protein SRB17_47070 [Streptomyces sp. RB17]|uniref:hypothetical protein n=1 Tax=Streptomyces sp. RB17 TaxID=2585197 RepID=UPI001294ECC4|nr:hypothetical protein [Streptomyces sp. RB17]MQY36705.1 hypothetical protein [Streptomyces sp. RB17]